MRKQRIVDVYNANEVVPRWQTAIFVIAAIIFNILFFIPLAAYFFYKREKAKKLVSNIMQRTHVELLKFIGSKPEHIDVSISVKIKNGVRLSSGGALAVANGKVYLVDEGIACELEYHEIRKWKWIIQGYDNYRSIGGGVTGGISSALATREAQVDAFGGSGFFVQVADIEKPEWHFISDDRSILTKWAEIFTRIDERNAKQADSSKIDA